MTDESHLRTGGQSHLRVGDVERDRVLEQLADAAAGGQLTLGELEVRSEQALRSTTRGDLAAVTHDLVTTPAPAATRRRATRWHLSLMGGSDKRGRWRLGRRLTSVAIMGGGDLDLRGAELDDDEVTITAIALMGGIDIYVPDSIDVDVSGFAVMGGNDERGSTRPPRPGAPLLHIRAFAIMGGVDVWRLPAESAGLRRKDARKAAKALEGRR